MKREPITHGGVFSDEAFAHEYARKHWGMAVRFGRYFGKQLARSGFSGGRVVDVGCGFGATLLTLAERFPGGEFVGVDLSDPLLGLATKKAREKGVGNEVSFERADVQDLPFAVGSFDVVINLNMVHLVEDPRRMLAEMERVLTPGGGFFLIDLRRSFLGWFEKEIRSSLSSREAKELLSKSVLRKGRFSVGPLWWRYKHLPSLVPDPLPTESRHT